MLIEKHHCDCFYTTATEHSGHQCLRGCTNLKSVQIHTQSMRYNDRWHHHKPGRQELASGRPHLCMTKDRKPYTDHGFNFITKYTSRVPDGWPHVGSHLQQPYRVRAVELCWESGLLIVHKSYEYLMTHLSQRILREVVDENDNWSPGSKAFLDLAISYTRLYLILRFTCNPQCFPTDVFNHFPAPNAVLLSDCSSNGFQQRSFVIVQGYDVSILPSSQEEKEVADPKLCTQFSTFE